MTSVPLADKRPPHLRPPPPSAQGSANASGFGSAQPRPQPSGLLDVDERATKRRKVDNGPFPGESGPPVAQVSSAATRTIPKYTNPQDLRLLAAVIAANTNSARQERKDVSLPEMPQHPWSNKDNQQKKPPPEPQPTHRSRAVTKVPCTPDALQTPQSGPVLVNDRPAGYFPWGVKPSAEDQLSEVNVKQGYYDRPPNPPEKELNTARVPLYHAFKHRSGVESLSTIFSIILEAKSKHNMLGSASAFKPPPRVTLSEPKKKTWIGELADPTVPLKKLSRTIPQGIRGQGLLEQCLQNNVPLSRAIWFVKCVGANEIRTLKRKGTSQAAAVGGERNWLKDWTLNVEQYIEAVLNQNGQASWKQNLQYALRLTTRLYLENLVDRDHFLDWIVNTFAATSNDRLPFWLMMTHVFKQDIAKFRKRGSKLAEMLLRRFMSLKNSTNTMVQTTVLKIKDAIRGFAVHRPQLFLAPDCWPELKAALRSCLRDQNALELRLWQRLDFVNERCMGASKQQYLAKPVPRDSLVGVLDAAKAPYNVDGISQALFSQSADYSVLVSAVAEWATTIYRCGTERIYLASRILRKWQKSGLPIDTAILDFVAKCHSSPELFDSVALRHLAAELSRSRAFPSSKYMQWLSVRGLPWPNSVSVSEQADPQDPSQRFTRQNCKDGSLLLADLLFSEPDSHHLNLRNSLLSRAGFDIEREVQSTQRLQSTIRAVLQQVNSDESFMYSAQRLTTILKDWNWRVRSALAHGLRGFVVAKVKQQAVLRQRGAPITKEHAVSLRHYEFVRTCLEALGDEAVLADVVGLCYQIYDEALQAALANTLYRHAGPFSAIGALESLQTRLCQNYFNLRNVKLTMPLFATALMDLCTAYPTKLGSLKMYQQDLVCGDRTRAIAACSPFSDGIAESLQNAEETFIDDFEAVLQSEPSMAEQTMSRLFKLLAEKIEKQAQPTDNRLLFTYCQLMARLRLCRKVQGDQLLRNWLVKLLSMNPTGFAQVLVSYLIDVGALTVTALVDAFAGHRLAAQILQHTFPDRLPEQRYSVSSKWIDFAKQNSEQLLNLISQVPRSSSFDIDELCVNAVLKPEQSLSKSAEAQLKRKLNETICRGNGGDVSASLEAMDVFSLPFVRFHLQLSAMSGSSDAGLADAIVSAAAKGSVENIAKLLRATGPELASQVRQMLDDNIMEMLPLASQGRLLDVSLDPERMERLQVAVDQAFLLFPPSSSPSSKNTAHLIEKLQQFLKFLGSLPAAASASSPSAVHKQAAASPKTPATPSLGLPSINTNLLQPSSPMDASLRNLPNTIIDYFQILLNLLCLQRPTHAPSKDMLPANANKPQSSRPEYVKILAYVAHIATHPAFLLPQITFPDSPQMQHRARETVDFAYDVMATYVDEVSEDNRVTLAKILKDRLSILDPSIGGSTTITTPSNNNGPGFTATRESQARLRWLFGSVNAMGSDLPNAGEMGAGLLVQQKRALDGSVRSVSGTILAATPSTPTVSGFSGTIGILAGEQSKQQQQNEKTLTMDWRPRIWEVLESSGRPDGETSLGLGLFGARRPWPVARA